MHVAALQFLSLVDKLNSGVGHPIFMREWFETGRSAASFIQPFTAVQVFLGFSMASVLVIEFRRACKVAGSGGEILLDHHHKPAFITSTAGHRPSSWLSTQSCRDQPRSNCLQFVAGHRSSDSNNLFVHLSSLILATWPAQFYAVFLPQVLCNVVSQTQSNH